MGEARLLKNDRVIASTPMRIINSPMGGADRFEYTVRVASRSVPSLPRFRLIWEVTNLSHLTMSRSQNAIFRFYRSVGQAARIYDTI